LRVVAEIVRNKDIKSALDFLKFAPTKWASLLYKILYSAVKNAENNNDKDSSKLYIGTLIINKWIVYKRWQAISRWRSHPILKRTSNITLELQEK
jgi:large subunit ribosomal protein L22